MKFAEYSYKVADSIEKLGFPPEFGTAIGGYMNTEFTSKMMLGYLRDGNPGSMEEIVDEMLGILEFRNRLMKKHITESKLRKRTTMDNDLYIRGLNIDWSNELLDSYLGEIETIRNTTSLYFSKKITFFVGENGSGKSTLLEAIAIASGLNPEGGTGNYQFTTYDDFSMLGKGMKLIRGHSHPLWKYFLRSESFYNVATVTMTEYNDDGRLPDYHSMSHGESFFEFIKNNDEAGLYLMDEPEAALSVQKQLSLLVKISDMAKEGSQFIIATHSPILLGTPDAEILSFDNGYIHRVDYEETESYKITELFINHRETMLKNLFSE